MAYFDLKKLSAALLLDVLDGLFCFKALDFFLKERDSLLQLASRQKAQVAADFMELLRAWDCRHLQTWSVLPFWRTCGLNPIKSGFPVY
jgi:hypothetical protein